MLSRKLAVIALAASLAGCSCMTPMQKGASVGMLVGAAGGAAVGALGCGEVAKAAGIGALGGGLIGALAGDSLVNTEGYGQVAPMAPPPMAPPPMVSQAPMPHRQLEK